MGVYAVQRDGGPEATGSPCFRPFFCRAAGHAQDRPCPRSATPVGCTCAKADGVTWMLIDSRTRPHALHAPHALRLAHGAPQRTVLGTALHPPPAHSAHRTGHPHRPGALYLCTEDRGQDVWQTIYGRGKRGRRQRGGPRVATPGQAERHNGCPSTKRSCQWSGDGTDLGAGGGFCGVLGGVLALRARAGHLF